MIRWRLVPSVYARFMWPDGRICCELSLDRVTGQIVGVTLLNPPRGNNGEPVASLEPDDAWIEEGVPVLDREPFDLNPDLDPQIKVADVPSEPWGSWDLNFYVIRFAGDDLQRWIQSGPVGFGITGGDELVALRIARSALPATGQLAQR